MFRAPKQAIGIPRIGPESEVPNWVAYHDSSRVFPFSCFSHLAQLSHTATVQRTAMQAVAGRIKSLEEEQRELVEYQQLESSRPVFSKLSRWVAAVCSMLKNCGSINGRPPFWFYSGFDRCQSSVVGRDDHESVH